MDQDLVEKKKLLIEKLGVFIEKRDNLAPVAARILSYIILTGKTGTTFEDLVTDLCASKSTISTHLNHLLDLKSLNYFTKPGDRKKYYILNRDSILQNMDKMIQMWKAELDLHLEIKQYKKDMNVILDDESKFEMTFHNDYITYLNVVMESVVILKEKLTETHS